MFNKIQLNVIDAVFPQDHSVLIKILGNDFITFYHTIFKKLAEIENLFSQK